MLWLFLFYTRKKALACFVNQQSDFRLVVKRHRLKPISEPFETILERRSTFMYLSKN